MTTLLGSRVSTFATSAPRSVVRKRCRPLTLVDLMILVAAVAIGLRLDRSFPVLEHFGLPRPWSAELTCLATLTVAALILRHRQPRPRFRALMRQPGAVATHVVVLLVPLTLGLWVISWGIRAALRHYGLLRKNVFPLDNLLLVLVALAGALVAGAWLGLAISGRRRPEPGWLDRLGRVLGHALGGPPRRRKHVCMGQIVLIRYDRSDASIEEQRMLDLGFLLLLSIWSAGVGLWIVKRFSPLPEETSDALALAIAAGLGALGLGALALGLIGRAKRRSIAMLMGLGALVVDAARFDSSGCLRSTLPATVNGQQPASSPGWDHLDFAFGLALAATLLGTLLTALAPVTDGDALCYHLQVPKRFLARGVTFYDPDLHETVYPLLTEILYAVALAFRGPVACRLVEWLLGVVFALNVTALARPSLGHRAWWAGTIALLVPAVSNGMSAPLNDVALAAFGTSALFAWSRFHDRPTVSAAALTGLFTGLALGVKYPALVLAGLIALGLLSRVLMSCVRVPPLFVGSAIADQVFRQEWSAIADPTKAAASAGSRPPPSRHQTKHALFHLLVFTAFAWGTGGVWYARALINTGNPVYPFFRSVFGGAGLDEVLAPEKRPLEVGLWNLLTALKPLTLEPDRFDSFSHQFGPIFLLFLPALFWERPPRRVVALAAIGYGFLMLCLTQRQSMRFLLIAIGPMSVGVAWLASVWSNRRSIAGHALIAALLLVLGFETSLALARSRHGFGVVIGRESPEHFLSRREPTFVVGRWVDAALPKSARLVGQDHRGFYVPRDYTMELAHRRRTGLGRRGESPAEVVARLREAGFTHVMLCPPVPESAVEFDPTLGRLLDPWLADRDPLYLRDLTDGDGVLRRYTIYALDDDRLASHSEGSPRP